MGCEGSKSTATESTANMPLKNLKLIYFNIRGRGEIIRLVLAQADIKYEDQRIEQADWPALKAEMPFGSCPVLQSGDHKLGQSNVIARFVAKEGGLMGKDNFEAALADSINETLYEMQETLIDIHFTKDEEAKTVKQTKFKTESFPTRCGQLNSLLEASKGGDQFFLPSGVSLADLRFYQVMTDIQNFTKNDDVLNTWPKLEALRTRVADLPKIKEWVEKRPETDM